jgi:hypothetical protein
VFSLKIKGIKCDNCNYREELEFDNPDEALNFYRNWINKPCPECGGNLLTVRDYISLKILVVLVKFLNKVLPEPKESTKKEAFSVEMNGTGKMVFKKIEDYEGQ